MWWLLLLYCNNSLLLWFPSDRVSVRLIDLVGSHAPTSQTVYCSKHMARVKHIVWGLRGSSTWRRGICVQLKNFVKIIFRNKHKEVDNRTSAPICMNITHLQIILEYWAKWLQECHTCFTTPFPTTRTTVTPFLLAYLHGATTFPKTSPKTSPSGQMEGKRDVKFQKEIMIH